MTSYFFSQISSGGLDDTLLKDLEIYSETKKQLVYVISGPLDQKYSYDYQDALILLSPRHKISVVDFGQGRHKFENYVEDFLEDLTSISDKYLYRSIVGRPRNWKGVLIEVIKDPSKLEDIPNFFTSVKLKDPAEIKKVDLLISLLIGSINDVDRVKDEVPETVLDKVKQKIQLFDGDQTRFVYQVPHSKRVTIQGLSGTGKTELLLHKLKDLYIQNQESKIFFTCHNKVLSDNLRQRIPSFFNFMKVEQQIDWEKRFWCRNAWGSGSYYHSGVYSYICHFYSIPFYRYSSVMSFSKACELALKDLQEKYIDDSPEYAFSYIIIDESQDFDENFFKLCEFVTEKNVYIAGDIFQSIFDQAKLAHTIKPDYLLGKCYRTDPKTLMFGHALGMGLFEKEKLRWLDENEWIACGYNVSVDARKKLHLSREPLRRFEDIDDDFDSIEIIEAKNNLDSHIIDILSHIVKENETVLPEDIGIILLDDYRYIYDLADQLEVSIQRKFSWPVNKAYETKTKRPNQIFLSNKNNVKGLEFPFVICVTIKILKTPSYRNSLYTMITRSFIKTYFLIKEDENSGLSKEIKDGLDHILRKNEMVIDQPSETEQKKIMTRFMKMYRDRSYHEIMMDIFRKKKIEKKYHNRLFSVAQQLGMMGSDEKTLTQFVIDNLKYLEDQNG
ncbi:DEAD/DEAH box helicase [Pollutibacter soli]|uniref:DEAD/DEAH box helicase n=1 Tax=Pollutibacter soli TaxID=3034157 RepID=UPI003013FA7F